MSEVQKMLVIIIGLFLTIFIPLLQRRGIDHFGQRHGPNLSPMLHEKNDPWAKIAHKNSGWRKFYPDCAEVKKKRNISVFDTSMLRDFPGKVFIPTPFYLN